MSSRKQIMHIAIIVALALMVCLVGSNRVEATEPEGIQLTYDFGAQTLAVNVSHYFQNKNDYIETIQILKNDIFFMNRTYENQSVDSYVYDTFTVSASVDDNITVTAFCSRGYLITAWLIVSSTTSTSSSPTETTTTTTQPTNGEELPGASLGTGPAIIAVVGIAIALIIVFAWLNPDRVPDVIKQLGARIRSRLISIGEKIGGFLQQIRTK
ncbi:MAG: hypothetical protein ACFFEE_03695 [Candidatus Thorarchaeota archaeon]